jgi:spermidine/putrescine transport system substrate-binding protein
MKARWFRLVLALVGATALIGAACSSDNNNSGSSGTSTSSTASAPAELSGTVRIFSFEDELVPQVLDPFKKANPNLDVQTATFSSSDEAVTKLQAGFQADIVNVCVRDTQRLADLNLIQPIDTSRVTDWDKIIPAFKNFAGVQVNGQTYMVPNEGGIAGLVWNPKTVPNGLTSWKDVFEDPALKGKATVEDSPYYSIAIAALALGYTDPYSLTDADLEKVKNYFIAHKDQFRTFFEGDGQFLSLYKSGEIAGGMGFNDYPVTLAQTGQKADFAPAQEGTLTWTCGWAIPKSAQNLDAAYGVINHYLSPPSQDFYATHYNYWISNQDSINALPKTVVSDLSLDHPEVMQTAIATQIASNYDEWLKTWAEIKAA